MFDSLKCLTRPINRWAIVLAADLVELVTALVRRVTIALARNSDAAKIAWAEDLVCLTRPINRWAIALAADLVELVTALVRRVTIALARNSDAAK
ncbi:unnamed protein product, partial [Nippostrongylus brasiliensis]|uniref:Transposase n=1 Tax=Nippostrongylus brasiliensis TaxID=27835 RepID=A0A0N4XRE5_NIPBR